MHNHTKWTRAQLDKPDVDVIYDHLRLPYAGVGRPHCPECGEPVERQTPQQIVDRLLAQGDGVRVQVLARWSTGRFIRSPGRRRWTGAGSTRSTWSWTGSRCRRVRDSD
ncbi:hypothetical protein [Streptomyces mirabilis]